MIQQSVHERLQISPFMAAYVVVSMQIGIGVLGFQRLIARDAGSDAWISVLGSGLTIHIIVWMVYKICETINGDVMAANVFAFGKVIGKSLNTFFILYFTLTGVSVVAGLIEVIRTWMFLTISPLLFASVFLLLGVYIVYGGFRTVAGISFLGLIIPSYLLLSFGFALRYGDFTNLLPILDHSVTDLVKGGYYTSLSFIGYGVLSFFYPFIKKPESSKKWVHLGILSTTMIYTFLMIASLVYFPLGLLNKSIWATLEMWKIVRMPLVERFEYLGIANWALIILPNLAISLWCAGRIAKRVYHVNQRKAVLFVAIAILLLVLPLNNRERINLLFDLNAKIGFFIAYAYTPFLYLSLIIAKKVRAR